MKKLYSMFILAAVALSSQAAVEVVYKGQKVTENQEIIFSKDDVTPLATIGYIVKFDFEATGAAPIKVDAISDTNIFQLCTTPGTCATDYTAKDDLWKISNTSTGSPMTFDFSKSYVPAQAIPSVNTYFDITVTDNSGSKLSFKVKVNTDQAGVDAVDANVTSLKVYGKTLHYSASSPATIEVYSIAGNLVIKQNVSGNGSIDLSGIHTGMYIYRMGGTTGKFVIR